jgi:hypothetical protein
MHGPINSPLELNHIIHQVVKGVEIKSQAVQALRASMRLYVNAADGKAAAI